MISINSTDSTKGFIILNFTAKLITNLNWQLWFIAFVSNLSVHTKLWFSTRNIRPVCFCPESGGLSSSGLSAECVHQAAPSQTIVGNLSVSQRCSLIFCPSSRLMGQRQPPYIYIYIRRCLISDCFYGPWYVNHPPFLELSANPRAQVDCVHLQQQVKRMYIFEYSLIIMMRDVKLTVPK